MLNVQSVGVCSCACGHMRDVWVGGIWPCVRPAAGVVPLPPGGGGERGKGPSPTRQRAPASCDT
eukprot:25827-Eustigmatos_ZCMA.PRE.1